MAKSKYDEYVKPKLFLIEMWARDGLSDEQIAENIGIATSTYYAYKTKHEEFSEALKKGKEVSDYEVENALFKKTQGYNAKVKKAFKLKDTKFKDGRKVEETERIELVEEEVHVPADTTAQIYWLNNRSPNKWKNKPLGDVNAEMMNKLDEVLDKINGD